MPQGVQYAAYYNRKVSRYREDKPLGQVVREVAREVLLSRISNFTRAHLIMFFSSTGVGLLSLLACTHSLPAMHHTF